MEPADPENEKRRYRGLYRAFYPGICKRTLEREPRGFDSQNLLQKLYGKSCFL